MIGILAHGVGSRGDLPLPLWQFSWAATFAIVVSFVALGSRWTEPHLADAAEGRVVPSTVGPLRVAEAVARTLSLLLYALVVSAALAGADSAAANLAPVTIYVVVWVVVQIGVAFVGDVWRVLSPFDTMAMALDRLRARRPTARVAPEWSRWFAPVGAFGFVVLELVHPSGDSPRVLGWAILLYTAAALVGAWRWGREWLRRGETFAVHFGLLAAMSPMRRDRTGALAVRWPLSGLPPLRMTPAELATLLVVLGGVTWDGFGDSELWRDLVGRHAGWTDAGWRLFGLVDATVVVALLYLIGVRSMSTITGRPTVRLATYFAPSLVPIVLGYTVAHYLQLGVDEVQTFVFRLSDPFGRGWDLFGGAGGSVDYSVISVDVVAWCQALAVVLGHIGGVLVAHDLAVGTFDRRHAVRSQFVMLFVMIVYSVVGLWLLLNA